VKALSSGGSVSAAAIVQKILEFHPEYASGTARDVASSKWPDLEVRREAKEWLSEISSMFDPLLVEELHGRLVILALCRLDPRLGEYLRTFAAELKREVVEDFDSLLLPPYSGEQAFRREFLKILQNQAKLRSEPDPNFRPRSSGFLLLTQGGRKLDVLARLCFQQRYNACLTARYELSGNSWQDFEKQFLADLQGIAVDNYGTVGIFLPELGVNLRPGATQQTWRRIVTGPRSGFAKAQQNVVRPPDLRSLFQRWAETLVTGERIVVFIEWRGIAEGSTPATLGLTDEVLRLLTSLPERIGVVISGLPESVRREIAGANAMTLPAGDLPMLSQAFLNDTPVGPDRLKIVDEVQSLADAIALKKMNPPMVVGIFGGWGSGKSFVLHLIEERLLELRCQRIGSGDADSQRFPFVGHPYLIRFDAWTFAKSNLWASLMQTTLVELDRQLSLEHRLAEEMELDLREGSEVWRMLTELTDSQRERLLKTDIGKQALIIAADFAKRGSPGRLWDELEKLREEERKHLKTEEVNLQELRTQEVKARRALEDQVDAELSAAARRTAWIPVWQEFVRLAGDELEASGAKSFDEVVDSISAVKKFWLGLKNLSVPAAAFMVVAIAGGFLVGYLEPAVEWWSKAAGFVTAVTAPVLRAKTWFEARRAEYEQRLESAQASKDKLRDERIAEHIKIAAANTPGAEVRELVAKLADAEARVERIRARLGVTGHSRSLSEFLKTRIEEGLYQKELGLLDQVQSDIQELSDTLLPSRAKSVDERAKRDKLFPRGDPRVVLLIDDLDRCPPDKVVEVLEAAQLLVKTRLFVVVIAMDVRYVTRALEAEYKGVLVRSGEPSGLDYIEKIIQIPYRVRTVSAPAIKSFLRSQMEIIEPEERRQQGPKEEVTPPPESRAGEGDSADEQAVKARLLASARFSKAESTELPTEVIQFDSAEYAAISAACSALAVSPRAMKRLVNVFKLLKIIWYRQGLDKGPHIDVKQVILSTLALCSRYPEVLRKLLADMETAYRAESIPGSTPLATYLLERCAKGSEVALYPPDWEGVAEAIRHPRFFPADLTLSRFEEANLHLLNSFSFVGETDSEREATLQRGFYRNAAIGSVPRAKGKGKSVGRVVP
jgi:predicted KAP-like P-loop ATPase